MLLVPHVLLFVCEDQHIRLLLKKKTAVFLVHGGFQFILLLH